MFATVRKMVFRIDTDEAVKLITKLRKTGEAKKKK
jgi:hypothetical protein